MCMDAEVWNQNAISSSWLFNIITAVGGQIFVWGIPFPPANLSPY